MTTLERPTEQPAVADRQLRATKSRAPKPPKRRRDVSLSARFRQDRSMLLMVVPMVALLLLFTYIPLLGNLIAFLDYQPFLGFENSPWVGLDNFIVLFSSGDFWNALSNTLQITALQLLLFFPIPILLAVFLNGVLNNFIRGFVQSVMYLPHFLSWVIIVALFQQVLGGAGTLNRILMDAGIDPVDIMTNPDTFKLLVTAQLVWKDAGWGTIIFLAALATIDPALYESAAMDGAGRWRRFWHVTLPGIRPIILLLLILRLGDSLSVGFEQILLQRNAVGAAAGEVLDTYVYFNGVIDGNWSVATAAGLFKGVVGLALILASNRIAHAMGEQGVYSTK